MKTLDYGAEKIIEKVKSTSKIAIFLLFWAKLILTNH